MARRIRAKIGTYVLVFELKSLNRLTVGKLGIFSFPAGWYTYVGSAHGPGGLQARIGHHLELAPKPHWHMDYLRPRGYFREIWYGSGANPTEHHWSGILQTMPQSSIAARGFGSSDCRCDAHLIHFQSQPSIETFRRRQLKTPGNRRPPVYRLIIDAGGQDR